MTVVVAVAVAGVIFVGHGHGDGYVHDRDHHPPHRLDARVRLGKVSLSLQPSATLLRLSQGYGEGQALAVDCPPRLA